MRAVVFEKPSNGSDLTKVHEVAPPEPQAGEVLIRVECSGINYVDLMARRGDRAYVSGWPYHPGLEVAGTIVSTSDEDSHLTVGDRVAAFTRGGGLAEFAVADQALTVALPDDVPSAAAAAAPLMLSTAQLLLTAVSRLGPGDTLLMHSAGGGLGTGVAQIARVLGCRLLIGTVSSPDKEAAAKVAGWDHTLVRDHLLSKRVAELAPEGVDAVLDPLGTQMLEFDLAHAARSGRVVLFGNPQGHTLGDLPPTGKLISENLSVSGFSISSLTRTDPRRVADALREVVALLSAGRIEVPITVADGLEEVADVHDAMAQRRSTGKYVVQVA